MNQGEAPEVPKEKPAVEKETAAAEETVLLGSGDLLAGIPGEGALTVEQVDAWLADARNHAVLKPQLPLGLAAGAAEIKGIDENPLTRAKIELGRQLYFDTRLSSDNTVSCASCHDPEFGYAKDTQFGIGVDGQQGDRNSPVAYNRILSGPQFWDGRAESLEAQAVGPIANPIEMANTHENAVKTVAGIEGYQKQFAAVFEDGVTIDNIGRAIASFERAVVTGPAPWDYYSELASFEKTYADDIEFLDELKEEDEELYNEYMALKQASEAHPISDSAIRGGELFFSDKAGCTACHVGVNFADEKYHNLGVGMMAESPDLGRFNETNDEKDRGAFKTPTVRNVSLTAPYMHDGTQETLLEVVEWYAKGGHANDSLSEKIKKLELSEQDKKDLVAFMAEGLLGGLPKVETGRLPQ
ncbi:MAG: c-type cytochrome [Pirellulales bacterium]|nr:c-type cytochrome [Pirellulales bacterium]